jgi:hypothetical protein
MSWQSRCGRTYFYKTSRVNGRVVNHYFGRSTVAEAVAAEIELRKETASQVRLEICRTQEQLLSLDHLARAFDQGTDALVEASLRAAGYYRTSGHWRGARNVQSIARLG